MSDAKEAFNPFDPTGMIKGMRDSGMDAMAKMMVELVQTDAYAESTAKMLDAWLSSSAPFRKAMDNSMKQALANMKLASLDDITRLAERFTNMEMRLDDMDAKLDNLLKKMGD